MYFSEFLRITYKDPKKPGIIVFDEAAKKLHLDLNNAPLKIGNEDAETKPVPEKVDINFTSVKCGMRYAIFQDGIVTCINSITKNFCRSWKALFMWIWQYG